MAPQVCLSADSDGIGGIKFAAFPRNLFHQSVVESGTRRPSHCACPPDRTKPEGRSISVRYAELWRTKSYARPVLYDSTGDKKRELMKFFQVKTSIKLKCFAVSRLKQHYSKNAPKPTLLPKYLSNQAN